MARHKRQQAPEDTDPALDISSLIDVCFLLLIYFIVTSTIVPRESDLGLQLPGPGTPGDPPEIAPMLISIESSGSIYTGAERQPMDSDPSQRELPLLTARLEMYKDALTAAGETPLVQIYADGEASQQRVIDVLNALAGKTVQINSVTFTDLVE